MNPQSNQPVSTPKQDIITDTCILRYLNNKDIKSAILQYFIELINRGFLFAISEITIFELLSGNTTSKEQQGIDTLRLFKTFQVTENVLIAASRLSTLYLREKIPQENSISLQDKVIASTAIITGSIILSADTNDFPRPFFSEAEKKYIYYKSNGRDQMLVIELLRPDYTVLMNRFNQRP